MKSITKALVGTVAVGAMAMASAAPASAQVYRSRDRGGISAGEVIAGAVILGGIAAAAGAFNGRNNGQVYEGNGNYPYNNGYNTNGYYNNGYYNNGYNQNGYYNNGYNQGDPRQAVEQCVAAAENNANRYSYGGRSNVTDIRNIDNRRDGYVVKGRIAVNTNNRNWRTGWNNDYRGWSNQYAGYDAGNFTCRVQYGRVVDLDYSGIRGL